MRKKVILYCLLFVGVLFYLYVFYFQEFTFGKFRNDWRKQNNIIQIPEEWKCRFGNKSITCNDPKRKGSPDKIGYFNKYIIIRKNGESEEIDRIKLGNVNVNFNFLEINTISIKKEVKEVKYILQYVNDQNIIEKNETITKNKAVEMLKKIDIIL